MGADHTAGLSYDKYGEISWSNTFGTRMVSVFGPDANQFVFKNRGDLFSNSQGWDFFIGKFFRRGIMLLDFEEHRHHRRIMQNAFKKPVLVQYLDEMNHPIERGIQKWLPQDDFFVLTAIKKLTLDLATEVFMGEKLGSEASVLNKAFVDTVRAGSSVVRYPVPGGRWSKGLKGRKVLEAYFMSKIAEKRASTGNDLFSQEVSQKIATVIKSKGFAVKSASDADYHLTFSFGMSKSTHVRDVPVFIPDYGCWHYRYYHYPYRYGYTITYVPEEYTLFHKILLIEVNKNGTATIPVWQGTANCYEEDSDLRDAIDYLLITVFKHFGKNTRRYIRSKMQEDDPEVKELKAIS